MLSRNRSAVQVEGVGVATAPGITQWIPLPYGFFKEFLRDPLDYQLRARERFGDVFRSRIGLSLVHFLYHPDHVRRALTRLGEWLGRAVDEGRAALNSLRASTTETNDLVEALNRAAEDPTKPGAMSVSVVSQGQ